MSRYYLVTGYDNLGLSIFKRIWQGEFAAIVGSAEMTLAQDPNLASLEVDQIDFGPRGTLSIERAYETRVPF